MEQSRRHFYRAANAIFGRIGRIANEEAILYLLWTKCMPMLLYGFEAWLMKKWFNFLDFAVNRFFMKLFRTGDINIVNHISLLICSECFLSTMQKNSTLNTNITQTCYAKWLRTCTGYCEFSVMCVKCNCHYFSLLFHLSYSCLFLFCLLVLPYHVVSKDEYISL